MDVTYGYGKYVEKQKTHSIIEPDRLNPNAAFNIREITKSFSSGEKIKPEIRMASFEQGRRLVANDITTDMIVGKAIVKSGMKEQAVDIIAVRTFTPTERTDIFAEKVEVNMEFKDLIKYKTAQKEVILITGKTISTGKVELSGITKLRDEVAISRTFGTLDITKNKEIVSSKNIGIEMASERFLQDVSQVKETNIYFSAGKQYSFKKGKQFYESKFSGISKIEEMPSIKYYESTTGQLVKENQLFKLESIKGQIELLPKTEVTKRATLLEGEFTIQKGKENIWVGGSRGERVVLTKTTQKISLEATQGFAEQIKASVLKQSDIIKIKDIAPVSKEFKLPIASKYKYQKTQSNNQFNILTNAFKTQPTFKQSSKTFLKISTIPKPIAIQNPIFKMQSSTIQKPSSIQNQIQIQDIIQKQDIIQTQKTESTQTQKSKFELFVTPKIKITKYKTNNFNFLTDFTKQSKKKKKKQKLFNTKHFYTPTIEAVVFNIKGTKPNKFNIASGLGIRPLLKRG
jgi:hypothetical protein